MLIRSSDQLPQVTALKRFPVPSVSEESRIECGRTWRAPVVYVGAVVAAGAIVASDGTLAAAITAAALAGGTGGFIGSIQNDIPATTLTCTFCL